MTDIILSGIFYGSEVAYPPDCGDCPQPTECKASNDCAVMRQIRHGHERKSLRTSAKTKAEDKWVLSSFMLPADQTWCWVSDGKSVWHGKRDVNSAGGWTNEDTWEDFASAVTHWQAIARPEPPQE